MNCPHDRSLTGGAGATEIQNLRTIACGVCGCAIEVNSVTNTDAECPELVALTRWPGHDGRRVWWGIVQEGDEPPALLVCCSTACMRRIVGK